MRPAEVWAALPTPQVWTGAVGRSGSSRSFEGFANVTRTLSAETEETNKLPGAFTAPYTGANSGE